MSTRMIAAYAGLESGDSGHLEQAEAALSQALALAGSGHPNASWSPSLTATGDDREVDEREVPCITGSLSQ